MRAVLGSAACHGLDCYASAMFPRLLAPGWLPVVLLDGVTNTGGVSLRAFGDVCGHCCGVLGPRCCLIVGHSAVRDGCVACLTYAGARAEAT